MDKIPKGRIETDALLQRLAEINSTPAEDLTPRQRIQNVKAKRAIMALARVSPEKRFEIVWKEARKRGLR